MSVFPLVALRFTTPQRKNLKRESSLLIESPAPEIKEQVEEIVSKANGNPINALAVFLHVAVKNMMTFTEFEFETESGEKKTTRVETHVFLIQGSEVQKENTEEKEVAVDENVTE